MVNKSVKRFSLLLVVWILSLCLTGLVSGAFQVPTALAQNPEGAPQGPPGGDMPGGPGGMPGGGAEGFPGGGGIDLSETSEISVVDGQVKIAADLDADYSLATGGGLDDSHGSGVLITSEVTGPTALNVSGSTFTLGGDSGHYTVTKDKNGVPAASPAKKGNKNAYNSVIILNDGQHTSEAAYADGAREFSLGVGVNNSGEGTLTRIENAYIWTSGSVRSAVAVKDLSKVVVENSDIESTGGRTCHKPVTRLLLSTCRSNVIMGGTAYYYNSEVHSYDWGALSTDTGGPNATYLYAYNMDTLNSGGGYGTYADTNCFVYIYGSSLTSAEMGGFVASNGELTIGSSSDATEAALEYMQGKKLKEAKPSVVTARRNAIVFHLVDPMSPGYVDDTGRSANTIGIMNVSNSTLSTVCELDSARDYAVDPNDENSRGECAYYVDHHKGSVIALRSSNADINLKHVALEAARNETTGRNVLVHSLLNYDARGAVYVKDGSEFAGLDIHFEDMDVSGDILHEDYHRKMILDLENTRIEGAIVSGTMANWNAIWKGIDSIYADEIYNMLAHDKAYKTVWGVRMHLDGMSAWTVTGDSSLYSLTIAEGADVNAPEGRKITIYKDCDMDNDLMAYDAATGTEVTNLEPGVTYKGVVVKVHGY